MDQRPQSAPPRWLLVASLALCLAGLGVAADLTRIHYKVHTDDRYQSFCAISKEVNCDTVAQSDWSVFLGLPISVWGLLGYVAMAVLCAWGLTRRSLGRAWPWGLLLLLTSFSVVVSVALFAISKLVIHSMCLMCLASWLLSAALWVLAMVAAWKVGPGTALREDFGALAGQPVLTVTAGIVALALLGTTWMLYPRYWELPGSVGPGKLATGVDESGRPWIGARSPLLVIEEYSDYECPHCSRAHRSLREFVEAHPDTVRLVHRNYPLDQACNPAIKSRFHQHACLRARAVVCAGEQGKLWEMNDLLFLGQRKRFLDVETLAARLSLDRDRFAACLESPKTAEHIEADMAQAGKLGIRGTPSYVVGGELHVGPLSAQELDQRLRARQLNAESR